MLTMPLPPLCQDNQALEQQQLTNRLQISALQSKLDETKHRYQDNTPDPTQQLRDTLDTAQNNLQSKEQEVCVTSFIQQANISTSVDCGCGLRRWVVAPSLGGSMCVHCHMSVSGVKAVSEIVDECKFKYRVLLTFTNLMRLRWRTCSASWRRCRMI